MTGEKERRGKSKIPTGRKSHLEGFPGGKRIKKKVTDIHFNPQLSIHQPIYTPETQKI